MTTHTIRGDLVPGAPFGRVIAEWLATQDTFLEPLSITVPPLQWLAAETHMDVETLRKLKAGKRERIGFDVADKIVTAIDPFLWRTDAELHEVYQSVDLEGLDRRRPCVAAA